jgi:hypothetical protein
VDVVLWKWIFSILFTLIVALILIAYGILSRCDVNRFKPVIIEEVKNATGRDLRMGGEIELAIGLTPALVVNGVGFQNVPWASHPNMVNIKRFEMQVALIPLLFGHIEVKRFVAIQPEVFIERHPSGQWNTQMGRDAKERAPTEKERPERWLSLFYFRDMEITGGRLICEDHQSGRSHTLVLNTFRARAAKPETAVEVSLEGAYEQSAVSLEGTTGPLAALFKKDKAWPLKVQGKLAGNAFSAQGAIRDVFGGKGLQMSLEVGGRSLRKASQLAAVSGVPELGPFHLSGEISNLEGPWRVRNIEAHVGTEGLVKLHLTGAVRIPVGRRGVSLRFTAKGRDVANLERITKRSLPLRGPFEISGRAVVCGSKKYTFSDLKVRHEHMDFDGRADIDVSKRIPSIKAVLRSKKMDLRPLMAQEGRKRVRPPRTTMHRVFSREPLHFDLLRQANGKVRLHAERALLPRLALTSVELDVIIQDGCLTARQFKGHAGGGTVEGFFDLLRHGKSAKMAMEMALRHVDVGKMLSQLKAKRVLEGDLDADIDLQSSGGSVAELMARLNGRTCVSMGTGRIRKEYVRLLEADLGAGVSRLFTADGEDSEYTEFNCFVSGFHIEEGLAEVTALVLDTDHTSVIGQGKINLKTEELDLSLKPFHKKGIKTELLGTFNLSFGELAKPFNLTGTLADPTFALDPAQAAITFGKAVGGVVLFGPLGIAVALAGRSPGDDNPCLSAIEAAKKGVTVSEWEKQGSRKGPSKERTEGAKDAFDPMSDGVR